MVSDKKEPDSIRVISLLYSRLLVDAACEWILISTRLNTYSDFSEVNPENDAVWMLVSELW